MSDEEFVRANWEHINEGVVMVYIGDWASGNHVGSFPGWAAAAEFTRERNEQIRQLEWDHFRTRKACQNAEWWIIHRVSEGIDTGMLKLVRKLCSDRRILARLESALADLRKDMRTAPHSVPSRRSDD